MALSDMRHPILPRRAVGGVFLAVAIADVDPTTVRPVHVNMLADASDLVECEHAIDGVAERRRLKAATLNLRL
jgi:hypothetical protein